MVSVQQPHYKSVHFDGRSETCHFAFASVLLTNISVISTMSRALLFAIVCIAANFPSVSGTATLVPDLNSAVCTGHLSDLSVTSITCDYSNEGCTFGSEMFITGQGMF